MTPGACDRPAGPPPARPRPCDTDSHSGPRFTRTQPSPWPAGKEVVYGLADDAASKAYEMKACEKAIPVKVTGAVEAAGERTITATRIERTHGT